MMTNLPLVCSPFFVYWVQIFIILRNLEDETKSNWLPQRETATEQLDGLVSSFAQFCPVLRLAPVPPSLLRLRGSRLGKGYLSVAWTRIAYYDIRQTSYRR